MRLVECAIVRYVLFLMFIAADMAKKMLLGRRYDKPLFIYSLFVGHSVSSFSLMYWSLWNQYKYIAFNIFSCRILIISYKMLTIIQISNETRNKLTIYSVLCRNVTIFYRQELVSLIQVQEKLKTCWNLKGNFSSSYLHITII